MKFAQGRIEDDGTIGWEPFDPKKAKGKKAKGKKVKQAGAGKARR